MRDRTSISRPCPYCSDGDGATTGVGCSECDERGQLVTTYMASEDGMSVRIQGSAALNPQGLAAVSEIAAAIRSQR
jgi:hypothetical protein